MLAINVQLWENLWDRLSKKKKKQIIPYYFCEIKHGT